MATAGTTLNYMPLQLHPLAFFCLQNHLYYFPGQPIVQAKPNTQGGFPSTTTSLYNAVGQPLTSTHKQLVSQLHPPLENDS